MAMLTPAHAALFDSNDRQSPLVVAEPKVRLTDQFSRGQLSTFWDAWRHDSSRVGAYLDPLPTHLEGFLAPIAKHQMHLWLILCDEEVAGAAWLHDICPHEAGRSAWLGLYHMSEFRGVLGSSAQQAALIEAQVIGIRAIFCGARHGNHRALRFAVRGGFHHLGVFRDFGRFDGELDALDIFTLYLKDQSEAWVQAEQRAQFNRSLKHNDIQTGELLPVVL